MDDLIKLNSQSQGRDKIARLIQYACRALWDSIPVTLNNVELIDKLKTLEYTLSSFRKLLRFGKCIDIFYSSLSSIHYPDLMLKITLTMSRIGQALFLLADHMIWIARSGLVKGIDTHKWVQISNKYWLLSITMNLVRDFYEISNIIDSQCKKSISTTVCTIQTLSDLSAATLKSYEFICSNRAIFVDTLKNTCDFFIPFTTLGYTKMSPRTVGVLGVISTIAGIVSIVKPELKLTPA